MLTIHDFIFPAIPKVPNSEKHTSTHKLFSQLHMLKQMNPTPDKWEEEFVLPLTKLLSKYEQYIELDHLGFPIDWKSFSDN